MSVRFERGRVDRLETLHPAYFALVMATGIVAIAIHLHGIPVLPTVLFWLNAFFFVVVAGATIARAWRYPDAFKADLQSHNRGVGFFTIVAASGVFGNQIILQIGMPSVAILFWIIAVLSWAIITYGLFAVLTVLPEKPGLGEGINGGWLVSVVATQSVTITTVLLLSSGVFTNIREPLMFVATVLWLGGGALYMWLMTLIFFRYTFLPMSPADLTPPYWINMGAVAISTLAGTTLLNNQGLSPLVVELAPFVKGVTLSFWAIGSWWIPMLVVLGVWRYVLSSVPFAYDPLYWGGVFPLGMYSVCTYKLSRVLDAPFLMPLSFAFMTIAALAWVLTFVGLIDSRINAAAK